MSAGQWFGKGKAFARDKRGNVAMMWGLMGTVLLGLVGLTVDFTRAQSVRNHMQNAADGAALVAERSSNLPLGEREAVAKAFFDAEMGDMAGDIQFSLEALDDGGHLVTARMPMPVSLARLVNTENWQLGVSSQAEASASPPIEVAIALDNTGSMSGDMDALRDGARTLVQTLLAIDGESVSVGIVPFVAQVNIGNDASHLAWMDQAGTNPHHGEFLEDRYLGYRPTTSSACTNTTNYPTTYGGFAVRWVRGPVSGMSGTSNSYCYAFSASTVNIFSVYNNLPTNARWGGCVESRPPPYDIDDTAPTTGTPATMFVPFFSLDEGGDETDGNNTDNDGNNWITSTTYDRTNTLGLSTTSLAWTPATGVRTNAVYKYRSGVPVSVATSNTDGRGPNRGCPTPIVPLTTDETTAVNAVNGMLHWYGGGTNQIEGLVWAWRVLSPGEPFTQGRPYDDPNNPVRKVIVLFTDGDNTSLDSYGASFGSEYSALAYRRLWREYQYTTYPTAGSPGIPSTWRRVVAGLNASAPQTNDDDDMVAYMNARQAALCDAIKDKEIEIYAIGFNIAEGGTADLLLQECATPDGSHYYHADSQQELLDAFDAIGSGIGDLRLTH